MGSIQEYIRDKAEKKKQSPVEWMSSAVANLPRYYLATHIAKFTHPDAKAELYDESASAGNGYLTTTDAELKEDFVVQGGAAYMPLASFLVKRFSELEDEKERTSDLNALTAWEHLQQDTDFIQREFTDLGLDYKNLRQQILAIKKCPVPSKTDRLLKQVYFPIGDDTYHLLSVMPPTSLMFCMTDKIEKASRHSRFCHDEKSEQYGESYNFIPDLTRISFGGTKPQNISCLNTPMGVDVLLSISPEISGRAVHVPKKNFFFDSLYWRVFLDEIGALHRLFINERNNLSVREKRDRCIRSIVWKIWYTADKLQDLPGGWSENTNLPESQKIWLDSGKYELQQKDDKWIADVSQDFARWLNVVYSKQKGALPLGPVERHAFAAGMEETLQQEVRGES